MKLLTLVAGILGIVCASFLIGCFLFRSVRKTESPGRLVFVWVLTVIIVGFWLFLGANISRFGALAPGLAAASGLILSVFWAPYIAAAVAKPMSSFYEGGEPDGVLKPLYSMAESRRKRGKYGEAVAEVRKQLEMFPGDYQGWMMLAEIQAEDMRDLPTALETIEQILALEKLPPKNIAFALGRVADWHLKLNRDPDAARAALERVVELIPGTEEARMATQRIAHVATREHLQEMNEPRVIALKHHEEKIGLQGRMVTASEPEKGDTYEDHAQRCVERLVHFPEDNETREQLARIYGDDYKRLELAAQQLEHLIATPNQKRQHVIHWLNMLADFQVRLTGDIELARQTLQRIVDLFPDSAGAANAQARMSQLKLELNQRAAQRTVKMGHYEQNIGLRKMNSSGTME